MNPNCRNCDNEIKSRIEFESNGGLCGKCFNKLQTPVYRKLNLQWKVLGYFSFFTLVSCIVLPIFGILPWYGALGIFISSFIIGCIISVKIKPKLDAERNYILKNWKR